MAITLTKITPAIGATVAGLDFSRELSQEHKQVIEQALLEHEILIFRHQEITPHQQVKFAANFGKLHIHPIYPVLPDLPEIMNIDTHENFLPDNDNWHTDVTFSATPPRAGILAAKRLPSAGGDTLWSSNTASYEALSDSLKRSLEGLTATHDVTKSFPKDRWGADAAFKERYDAAVKKYPPLSHPVIRTHPISGKKSLFVNEGFTTHIDGISQKESDSLLAFLFAHSIRPEFTLRWQWQVNDVAFWDNQVTQHYAVADYLPERRTMHRATIVGDVPF
ncbi:MAG: taurine dioxygenase [Methylophilus sp.]|nr:taurine dioxygenase [Methylophilus sp.]